MIRRLILLFVVILKGPKFRELFFRTAVLLILAGLNGCKTCSVSRDKRNEIHGILAAYKQAVNARSYASLEPLLAKSISVDGLPDELSRAALQSGAHWLPSKVEELQTISINATPDGFEAKIGLYLQSGSLQFNIGLDQRCKIRSIADDPGIKNPDTKASAPFTSTFTANDGLPFVKATIDGQIGYFLFDTGSSSLLLNEKYFKPTPVAGTPGISATVNGICPPGGSHPVRSFEWGKLLAKNLIGELHDFSRMERPEITPLLGAISHKELRNSSVVFDWKNKTIQIIPTKSDGSRMLRAGESPAAVTVPFTYFLHMPLVKAEIGTKSYYLLFDSGAQLNILPDSDGLDSHFHRTGFLSGFSSGGAPKKAHVPLGTLDRLTLGEAEYLSLPFAIYRIPYLQGNGMLGTPLLQQGRVEINFRSQQISLWHPDPRVIF